jgi:hypothetical protein
MHTLPAVLFKLAGPVIRWALWLRRERPLHLAPPHAV